MIKVKHLLDAVENDDGTRLWIEPIGLTKDLREWCAVEQVLSHLGPPASLREWFDDHPEGYGYFRAAYHEWLSHSRYRPVLRKLACASLQGTFTLLHQGEDPEHNTGTALHEFLSELGSYCRPDSPDNETT